ncbi:MAG: ATP-binding protein [Bacteroidota bacterium]
MENHLQEGEFLILITVGILIMTSLALTLVLFFNLSRKRILKEKMRAQDLKIKHQEDLLHSTIVTQEKERRRIAKDLHDDIGSKLNVINLNLHRLQKHSKDDTIQSIVGDVKALLGNTIHTTRRISHDLLPPTLEDFGLRVALQELCDELTRSGEVEVLLKSPKSDHRPEKRLVELNLFRVIQELISNSIRHGAAETIEVHLEVHKECVKINYEDNGKGFNTAMLAEKKGLGINNIESRLNMISGTIRCESTPGVGTQAFIHVKL